MSLSFTEEGFSQNNWLWSTTPYGHLKLCWVSEKKKWVNSKKAYEQTEKHIERQADPNLSKSAEYYFLSL